MDLRGLAPEDVYQLMSSGLNLRNIEENESANMVRAILGDKQLSQKAQQDLIENYLKGQKLQLDIAGENRLQKDQEFNQGKKDVTGTYTANGRVYRDVYDLQGNKLRTEDLGEAPQTKQEQKLLMTKEGKVMWAKPGDPIPDGATYVPQGQGQHPLSISDQGMLMSLQRIVEQGKDINGNDYEEEADRDNAMAVINASNPNLQYVKVPGKAVEWGKDIPAQYIKIPKQATQIAKLPSGTIVYHDVPTGKVLTIDAVRQLAKDKGYSVEEFLKISGIAK